MNLLVTDLHDTLIANNGRALVESTNYSLEKHGKKERVDLDFCKKYLGRPWALFFKTRCPDSSKEEIESMVETAKAEGLKLYPKYIKPMDNAIEVLNEIKKRGDVVVAMSSTTYEAFDGYLNAIGIRKLIDHKIGIRREHENDDSFDVVGYKANEIKKFKNGKNFDKKAVVGDSELDVEVGIITGLSTFFFSKEGRKLEKADYSISDLRELLPFFYEDYKIEL